MTENMKDFLYGLLDNKGRGKEYPVMVNSPEYELTKTAEKQGFISVRPHQFSNSCVMVNITVKGKKALEKEQNV